MDKDLCKRLSKTLTIRQVKVQVQQRGFRVRSSGNVHAKQVDAYGSAIQV
jgi:hypothetical protein